MEENKKFTKGGFQYEEITTAQGFKLKVRYSDASYRLTEDDENFEEYKLRLRAVKRFEKSRKSGFVHWMGTWGPMTKEKKEKIKSYVHADDKTKKEVLAKAEELNKEAVIAKQILESNEKIEK